MIYFAEGLISGLILAVSLGPIFFALTETSLERGIRPGLTVGLGIWTSDFLFVGLLFVFINQLKQTLTSEVFSFWMGLSGAIVFLIFGISLLLKKPKLNVAHAPLRKLDYFGYWLKGFLVNTINPFTVVFWSTIISTYLIGRKVTNGQLWTVLTTILIVIILSDIVKVYMAHILRKHMHLRTVSIISKVSGIILICFGLFLVYQVV